MKTVVSFMKFAAACGLAFAPLALWGQTTPFPQRFGVVDVTPNDESDESNQNSEPSLGVGLNANYGRMMVQIFTGFDAHGMLLPSDYYTTTSIGGPAWAYGGNISDFDATLDWSSGGTCYRAIIPRITQIAVQKSPDPTAMPFTTIDSATITKGTSDFFPDQPWIRVANVAGMDHIFVGYNDLSVVPGKTATVHYSLDSGMTWHETVLEKVTPGLGWNLPQVRLAISANGQTVYALFERANSWGGTPGFSDALGDVVLTRDDGYGGTGFGALGTGGVGTMVASGITLPTGFAVTFGAQKLGGQCDVAIDPSHPATIYVAYTEVSGGVPVIRLAQCTHSGADISLVYSIMNASLAALAVTRDGTLGMLYAQKNDTDLEVHFLKAFGGGFADADINDRTLAKFPDNNPMRMYHPYIGDYFTLRAVGFNFYGTFCASGDPKVENFPNGVFFQRNVKVGGVTRQDFWLSDSGGLVDGADHPIAASIDPFVFFDLAPVTGRFLLDFVPPLIYDPSDPVRVAHFAFPGLPRSDPPILPYSSPALGAAASWTPVSTSSIIQTNGQNLVAFLGTNDQQFFRLQQDVGSGQFGFFAASGTHGSLTPSGILTNAGLTSRTFTATPTNDYAVSKWYLDGVVVQSNAPSLTVSNITSEHTLVVTFAASNDLAVALMEFSGDEGPTETYKTNRYVIDIENKGLNTLTGVLMTNFLDSTVGFVSASTSQGRVTNSGSLVTAKLGLLTPGAVATISIQFVPFVATNIVDTVYVTCDQVEPDLANNNATNYAAVIDPVIITNQPASVIAPVGGTAVFSVGVTGTPPFTYQWFHNVTNLIDNATNATLILENLAPSQSGTYSVSVLQILGPEEIEGDTSDPATLTVQ